MAIGVAARPANLSRIYGRSISRGTLDDAERQHAFIIWFALIGVLFPPILISLGDINVTPGRVAVILLLIPALVMLFSRGRNRIASDYFAIAAAIWMVASTAFNNGFRPYVGAEALEFIGAYMVGRAFVFGPSNFETFVRALRPITVTIIVLAVFDVLLGRYVTLDSFGVPNFVAGRFGWVRASSVFEGAEHYGTFCVAAAAIFLYAERGISRFVYVSLCYFGCALSLSSGPMFGLAIVTAVSCYDRIMKGYVWRWKVLITVIALFLGGIFLISNHPIAWILTHFTLDSQTGFFRLGTWNFALPLIDQSPFVGHGVVSLGEPGDALIYLKSVDSLWLLEALRYGLPAVILLLMTMFSPLLKGAPAIGMGHPQTGLTLAIVATALIGLTVHFWDATWLFLNLCVGIRASLAEYQSREIWRAGLADRARGFSFPMGRQLHLT